MAALTDTAIRNCRPRPQPYKLSDGRGLFLHVQPSGSKLWRLRFWMARDGQRREKLLALGAYPSLSLRDARAKAEEARKLVAQGRDPVLQKKIDRAKVQAEQAASFETVARQWLSKREAEVTPAHNTDCRQRLEKHVFPAIGALPLAEISEATIAALLTTIQAKGVAHMAGRCHTMISQVFRFAIASGLISHDPARDVRDVLTTRRVRHMPALSTTAEVIELLEKIDTQPGTSPVTKLATRLLALLALRTKELRGGRWVEIDFDAATWTIPADRMKKRREHVVPLSRQALVLLRDLHSLTGDGDYMFPGQGKKHPILSEATINAAIKRAGYAGRHTGHGFRAVFSTVLNEAGHRSDAIEYALAHVSGDRVRAAYNRGDYLRERRELMQAWATLLECESARNVVPIGSGRRMSDPEDVAATR